MPTPATFAETPSDAVGRACPYCQTALAEADASAGCGDCGAVHHAECWEENDGCAIPGCVSGPDPNAPTTEVVLPAVADGPTGRIAISMDDDGGAVRAVRQEVHVPASVPAGPRRRGRLAGVLVAVAIVAAIGAAAVFALGGDPPQEAVGSAGEVGSAGGGGSVEEVPGQVTSVRDMGELVNAYLGAIVAGDQDRAWSMLSTRRQTLITSGTEDKATWWQAQQPIREHLLLSKPAEVTIAPVSSPFNAELREILVSVGNIPWRNGGPRCPAFSGFIWGQFDLGQGAWKLEPEGQGLGLTKPFREKRLGQALGSFCA